MDVFKALEQWHKLPWTDQILVFLILGAWRWYVNYEKRPEREKLKLENEKLKLDIEELKKSKEKDK